MSDQIPSTSANKSIYYVYIMFRLDKPKGEYKYGDLVFDYEPFYVGKGVKDRYIKHIGLVKRYTLSNGHLDKGKIIKNKENYVKLCLMQTQINRGFKDSFLEIHSRNLSEIDALSLENSLVMKIGRNDLELGPLTNLTDGGDGVINHHHSKETRKLISDHNAKYWLGKERSSETTAKMSRSMTGKLAGEKHPLWNTKHSAASREKMSLSAPTPNEYTLIDPVGDIFKTANLDRFCKINGLNLHKMRAVVIGKRLELHGWKGSIVGKEYLRDDIESRAVYKLIDPVGNIYDDIRSLNHFCKIHKLDVVSMYKVVKGRQHNHQKWTGCIKNREDLRIEIESNYKEFRAVLVSPTDVTYDVTNLTSFCKNHDLDVGKMSGVINGKTFQHKGWTGYIIGKEKLRENIIKIHNEKAILAPLYKAIDPTGIVHIVEDLSLFCKQHNLRISYMKYIVQGKCKHHKGWTIEK